MAASCSCSLCCCLAWSRGATAHRSFRAGNFDCGDSLLKTCLRPPMRRTQPDFSSVLPTVVLPCLPPFLASQTSGAEQRGALRVLMVHVLLFVPALENPPVKKTQQTASCFASRGRYARKRRKAQLRALPATAWDASEVTAARRAVVLRCTGFDGGSTFCRSRRRVAATSQAKAATRLPQPSSPPAREKRAAHARETRRAARTY